MSEHSPTHESSFDAPRRSIATRCAILAVCAAAGLAVVGDVAAQSGTAPTSRRVEVRSKEDNRLVETRETAVQPKASHTRVHSRDAKGKEHTVVVEREGRNVIARYAGPDKTSATVKIVDGKPQSSDLRDKPAVKRALDAELARLQELDGPASGVYNFTASPDDGAVAINWDCEMATLKAIVKCGTFQILECGDAVHNQMCKCAPKDSAGNPPAGCD